MIPDFPFLQTLSADERQRLLSSLPVREYQDSQVIFECGDSSADVYFILQGVTKSLNISSEGKMAYFRLREQGDFFGYYSALTAEPRTATMVAVGPTRCAVMPGPDFVDYVVAHPGLARALLQLVAGLLREETRRITALIALDARQRLAAEIVTEAARHRKNQWPVPARSEWASHLGITRETLSRLLSRFQEEKLIELHEDTLTVIDGPRLADVSMGQDIA